MFVHPFQIQERLIKKLGDNAVPFNFIIPPSAPASITLQQAKDESGEPCGVQYYVKIFAGDSETDRTHRRSTVSLGIRKVQFAPSKQGNQPCTGKTVNWIRQRMKIIHGSLVFSRSQGLHVVTWRVGDGSDIGQTTLSAWRENRHQLVHQKSFQQSG